MSDHNSFTRLVLLQTTLSAGRQYRPRRPARLLSVWLSRLWVGSQWRTALLVVGGGFLAWLLLYI